ncbi:hypothetical protein [Streptomyces rishiriensis]|uniref:Uncharacterized protein n=1 Tax=Streptomyces rishiriensis TaxID=68264 RepID=A0ABU0P2B1_STRRH|nr:hypothetical protein [Streptomyces rishiriensis]MDQ0585532.1 hypothetical protein [Streptomyces rishiriensis]
MPFEDELGKVLRDTAGTFTADRRSLAEGSLTRGRRRLARRRASAVAGSALAVVLVATAGVQLGGGRDGDGKAGGPPSTPAPGGGYRNFAVTAEEMENILQNGMERSGIGVGHPKLQAQGSSEASRSATASIDFEDGFSAARVTLSVRRVDPAEDSLRKLITCPPEGDSPYEECTAQPDNRAVKGYTEAGKAGGIKKWAVTMLSPSGYLIEVATNNVASPINATEEPLTRNPRMNPGKLRYLAMFVDGSFLADGKPNSLGTAEPGSTAEPGDILPLLKDLLPERLHVYSEGGTATEGHVVVVDSKSRARTYIEATRTAGDKEAWNETLADGTKVGTRQLPGRQPGVVQLRVDALRVNGLWMSVSAYNAPSPTSRKSGASPLITAEELKAIATSRSWLIAR